MNPPRPGVFQTSANTAEDIFLTLAVDETQTTPRQGTKPLLKDERKSRLAFGSPKRFSPSRLLSRRTNNESVQVKPTSSPLQATTSASTTQTRSPPSAELETPSPHSPGDKRQNSTGLPDPKRRRVPISDESNTMNNALRSAQSRRGPSPSVTLGDSLMRTVPQYDGINSLDSSADTSSVWDELDDIKTRIQKLEITASKPKERLNNGITEVRGRPTTRMTNIPPSVASSIARKGNASPSVAYQSPRASHQLLSSALAKAESLLSSEIYTALESTVADAFDLSSALLTYQEQDQLDNFDSMSNTIRNNHSSNYKRLNRKAENLCRNLTDLCISLCDIPIAHESSQKHNASERSASRLSAYNDDERSASRFSTHDSPFTKQNITSTANSSPLTHLDERRARLHDRERLVARPASQLRRAKTGDPPSSTISAYTRRPSLGSRADQRAPSEDRDSSYPPTPRARVHPTAHAPRAVSSASAYAGGNEDHYGSDNNDDEPTVRISSRATIRPPITTYSTNPNAVQSTSSSTKHQRTDSPAATNGHSRAAPADDDNPYRQFSRAYTARHPMPELSASLSPKGTNRDPTVTAFTSPGASPASVNVRSTSVARSGAGISPARKPTMAAPPPSQPPPPPPVYAVPASALSTANGVRDGSRRRGSAVASNVAATGGNGSSGGARTYSPSAAAQLAERILERRQLLSNGVNGAGFGAHEIRGRT